MEHKQLRAVIELSWARVTHGIKRDCAVLRLLDAHKAAGQQLPWDVTEMALVLLMIKSQLSERNAGDGQSGLPQGNISAVSYSALLQTCITSKCANIRLVPNAMWRSLVCGKPVIQFFSFLTRYKL